MRYQSLPTSKQVTNETHTIHSVFNSGHSGNGVAFYFGATAGAVW